MKISACIIAKNEEKFIEKCLQSIKPVVDEIIVLDNGSTDKTKEIASKYAQVYYDEGKNDFSYLRNTSMSYATGDWILIIDADEILSDYTQKNIRKFLESRNNEDKTNAYIFRILSPNPRTGKTDTFFRDSLIKNNSGIKFVRPIHTHLDRTHLIAQTLEFFEIINNKNFRDKDEAKSKLDMYFSMIYKAINEADSEYDKAHYIKHLIRDYEEAGMSEKEMEHCYILYNLYKKMDYPKRSNDYYYLLLRMIRKKVDFYKDYSQAEKFITEISEIFPDQTEILYYQAVCYYHTDEKLKARDKLKEALFYADKKHPQHKDFVEKILYYYEKTIS